MVASGGLEPPHPKAVDFESTVSTIPPQGHLVYILHINYIDTSELFYDL